MKVATLVKKKIKKYQIIANNLLFLENLYQSCWKLESAVISRVTGQEIMLLCRAGLDTLYFITLQRNFKKFITQLGTGTFAVFITCN